MLNLAVLRARFVA